MKLEQPAHNIPSSFATLILPVPIPKLFTYRVPNRLRKIIEIGQCAIIPFGKKKIVTGIVANLHKSADPAPYHIKDILDIVDENKLIHKHQFDLYQWVSEYYMCTQGEVMQAALPSGLQISSKSIVQFNPAFNDEDSIVKLSDKEQIILKRLERGTANYPDIARLLKTKNIYPALKSLSAKKAIILFEQIQEKYKPKTEKRIRLTPSFIQAEKLEKLFKELTKKPKQEYVLLQYLQRVQVLSHPDNNIHGISLSTLTEGNKGTSSLQTLIKTGVFEKFQAIIPRYKEEAPAKDANVQLSPQQQIASNEIVRFFKKINTVLLHGITGSGKTEIYIDLINKTLKNNQQALMLIPEIALTTQIVQRLKKTMGAKVGVYHSKFSDNERVEIWRGVLSGKFRFIVGVRSSVFLPFTDLGLIIVDEEHDSSYKQHDPAPRYNARDVALIMSTHHKAKVLLGSATPSAESYFQATQNKYGLVCLTERFGDAVLPDIIFADMLKERRRKANKGKFSSLLIKTIQHVLQDKEQVLLFQNRRGYAPMAQCEDCNWAPECVNCSVHLTYHQFNNKIICHYCDYSEPFPSHCPSCDSKRVLTQGYGTERLEEELKLIFEKATVRRMDRDTTRTRVGYESIIEDFAKAKTQILVGTQMITKGLDFDHVGLVGIIDADRMRHFPDFRSHERTFQLITQASGRAGRRAKKGKVIIQTADPSNALFNYIRRNDVKGFILNQLHDRHTHKYPPYVRLIEIIVKHVDKLQCKKTAVELVKQLVPVESGAKVIGPGEPVVSKVRNEFLRTILIKIIRDRVDLKKIKQYVRQVSDQMLTTKEYRQSKIVFNVDPMQ